MQKQRKALGGALTALAAVGAAYVTTGQLDQAGLVEGVSALAAGLAGYVVVYYLRNDDSDHS